MGCRGTGDKYENKNEDDFYSGDQARQRKRTAAVQCQRAHCGCKPGRVQFAGRMQPGVKIRKTDNSHGTTGKKDSYSTDIREDTVKFNQMWDLVSGKKEDYGRYTIDEFYPALEELGISIAREWEVLIGEGPSIICEGRATDIDNLIRNLQSDKFRYAKRNLKEYVENYESRILTFHIQKIKGYKSASYNILSD